MVFKAGKNAPCLSGIINILVPNAERLRPLYLARSEVARYAPRLVAMRATT